jgi:1,4-alpha-glucan branching enzyme
MATKKNTTPKTETTKVAPKTALSKITFTLAKDAINNTETVAVLGSFNNWTLDNALFLKKQKDGSFKGSIELTKGDSFEYRFLINNNTWINDTNATDFVPTPFGSENCVAIA